MSIKAGVLVGIVVGVVAVLAATAEGFSYSYLTMAVQYIPTALAGYSLSSMVRFGIVGAIAGGLLGAIIAAIARAFSGPSRRTA